MKRIAYYLAAILFAASCTCSNNNGAPADPTADPSADPGIATENPVVTEDDGVKMAAVDLGLSVRWASANIGADAPEQSGDYYAWGETEPKAKYDWESYKWCKGGPGALTKYNTESGYGKVVDNLSELKTGPEGDDVASKLLGGTWRIPTEKEWRELLEKCKWTRTEQNGVKGFLVSADNGNSIFFPAAGSRDKGRLSHVGEDGFYWSSSLLKEDPNLAWSMHFGKYGSAEAYMYHARNYGQSIRAVCK